MLDISFPPRILPTVLFRTWNILWDTQYMSKIISLKYETWGNPGIYGPHYLSHFRMDTTGEGRIIRKNNYN